MYVKDHKLVVALNYVLPILTPILADDRSFKRETAT
jgi:hypothetical protein